MMNISTQKAIYFLMDENIPQTVEEIEKSKWFKKLYKPEIIAGLESGAEHWL